MGLLEHSQQGKRSLPGEALPRGAPLTVAHQGQRAHKHDHSLEGVRVDHRSQATWWGEQAGDGRCTDGRSRAGPPRSPRRSRPTPGRCSAVAAR